MSKRIFTKEQMDELLHNPNVTKCSEKSITFSKEFKVSAVMRYYEEGLPPSQIFTEAGFDLDMIGTDTPKDRLVDWRRIYNRKGNDGLRQDKGRCVGIGRPKTKDITPEYKIKRLEAEVAYLRAENDFLVELRAKKRTE